MADRDEIPEDIATGPAMVALNTDRQRKFAYVMGCGETNQTEAARVAGFSDAAKGASVFAARLMQNEKILAAIHECSKKVLRGLAPVAIRRARDILDNPKHPAHTRMIETILDRTGYSTKTEHRVTVEHTVETSELEALAARLANEAGIDPARLIGVNGSPKLIEGVVESEVHVAYGRPATVNDPVVKSGK